MIPLHEVSLEFETHIDFFLCKNTSARVHDRKIVGDRIDRIDRIKRILVIVTGNLIRALVLIVAFIFGFTITFIRVSVVLFGVLLFELSDFLRVAWFLWSDNKNSIVGFVGSTIRTVSSFDANQVNNLQNISNVSSKGERKGEG